jgi:hypothetical protein
VATVPPLPGSDEPVISIRASLDVPGETRRQATVFAIWFLFLLAAVFAASVVGTHIPAYVSDVEAQEQELSRSRAARAKVALLVGLVCPSILTLYVSRRRRRGGRHARGIRLEITREGELRMWGRGYGTRLPLAQAHIRERVVDLYAGRLERRERRLGPSGSRNRSRTRAADDEDEEPPLGERGTAELDRADFSGSRPVRRSCRLATTEAPTRRVRQALLGARVPSPGAGERGV